jgi:hypothetical protein
VFRTTRQEKNRQTGKVCYVKLPQDQWLVRESPHLRILSDELAQAVRDKLHLAAQSFGRSATDRKNAYRADLYPKVLIRPICGGCGQPMILGRSVGKYQSFCCHNALHGMKGCTNRGYKSARIIDEAVLGAVKATMFDDGFIADLTADVNARLAELPRRPRVKSVRETDVVAALTRLCELLQGDVGLAAQVLKALVGDVVLELRQGEGQTEPQMVARFTIHAIPALVVLDRRGAGASDGKSGGPWDAVNHPEHATMGSAATPRNMVVPLTRKCHRATSDVPVMPPADSRPSPARCRHRDRRG